MEIYQLTGKGQMAAHNIYAPENPRWKLIQFMYRRETATKEQMLDNVPSATWHTINYLRRKGFIQLVGKMAEV